MAARVACSPGPCQGGPGDVGFTDLSDLAADACITQPTARGWLHALEIAFLVAALRPHHKSFRRCLRSRPRLYFLDTGLVCDLLGIHSADILERHPLGKRLAAGLLHRPA